MAWHKYFKTATPIAAMSPLGNGSGSRADVGYTNFQSQLPEVYIGHPNRMERYNQYEQMDLDTEINGALDILAEFCTQTSLKNNTSFMVSYKDTPTDSEIKILREELQKWYSLNKLDQRMFRIFRNTLKYGDQVFIRDPETFELFWVEMAKVTKVIVNESEGKEPEQYVVKDIGPNLMNLSATQIPASDTYYATTANFGGGAGQLSKPNSPYSGGSRFGNRQNEVAINAEHVVHLSLSEGLDAGWPFGNSVLENIYKVFKQKELLEDCLLIYRVQRAPERRVFYIDVGSMPSHMAMAYVERIKNEVHQKRIPSKNGDTDRMDATYNPLCLDLDTKIPLLDGRTLPLSQLITEFESGKENWCYSCDPVTGEVMPGVINWAGTTRKNTETIKLTFDNGKELICTPDHKIPVLGKGFVEAKDLTTTDSLIAFNTREQPISGGKTNNYQQVWDHASKTWKWTHRVVGEFFRNINKHQEFTYLAENVAAPKTVIHHKDCDRFNNDPRNLTYMNKEDHILYHSAQEDEFWKNTILTLDWKNLSAQERLDTLYKIRVDQNSDETVSAPIEYSGEMGITDVIPAVKNSMWQRILGKLGLNKADTEQNICKLVKIEKVTNRDTGTITVDGYERWHNHHTFAIDSGIFVKNSMNEDFFFPQTGEGRGSKVETLPGGTNLGEIDDLRYFTNKMFRGLRIPSSYLPTGPDDGSQSVTDGKVGTALIQEWRFNQYCIRLQKYLSDKLDNEFKMFLSWRGFNIDSSLFELRFNEPQNFAQYKQAEMDAARISGFTQLESFPYLSKRFLLQRYLGLTEEEMQENDALWADENGGEKTETGADGLRGIGITPGGIEGDMSMLGGMPEMGQETPGMGQEPMGAGPVGTTSPLGSPTPAAPTATPPAA